MNTPDGLSRGNETICTECDETTEFFDDDGQPYCEDCWEKQLSL